MLKLVFWLLLAINALVFASSADYSGILKTQAESRAPEPVEPDRIRVLSSSLKTLSTLPVTDKKKEMPTIECIELANFNSQNADIFEKKMALPANQLNRTTTLVVSSYMVYIPPFKNRKMAEKRISELQAKGITNYFLIPEGARFRHAISLGLFKTEESAKNLITELERHGIHDATITARGKATESVSFRLNNLKRNQADHLNALLSDFPQVIRKDCSISTEVVQ